MSKISRILKDAKNALNSVSGLFYYHSFCTDSDKLKEYISIFDHVKDSRIPAKCSYSARDIIAVVFLALLDERHGWNEIEDYCYDHREMLSLFTDFDGVFPSHDTFCRVFSLLNTDDLQKAVVSFLCQCIESVASAVSVDSNSKVKVIAMDGKEERGSGRKYDTDEKVMNAQIMHFYDTDTEICISSALIDDKTNEIPTAQSVLRTLNIKGMVITADAMNAQKETVQVICNGKGHYVLGLKGNHKGLHEDVAAEFAKTEAKGRIQSTKNYHKMETEKNHNQVEIREYFLLPASKFYQEDDWQNIRSVVMYKKTMYNIITKKESVERRYYISDLTKVNLISECIRTHWSVENGLHWHLDTSFYEDANSTMNKKALHNLSVINKMVLTLIKLMAPLFRNGSVKRTQKSFRSHYEENVLKMFIFLQGKDLQKIFKKQNKFLYN